MYFPNNDISFTLTSMEEELILDGKRYISTKRAAQLTGYTKDYVGQLCRAGKIDAKLVGRSWYVNEEELRDHKSEGRRSKTEVDREKLKRQERLMQDLRVSPDRDLSFTNETDERPLLPTLQKTYSVTENKRDENESAGTIIPIKKNDQPVPEYTFDYNSYNNEQQEQLWNTSNESDSLAYDAEKDHQYTLQTKVPQKTKVKSKARKSSIASIAIVTMIIILFTGSIIILQTETRYSLDGEQTSSITINTASIGSIAAEIGNSSLLSRIKEILLRR